MQKDFYKQVHEVAQKIPYGRVTSYGAIASYLGSKKSARIVGWAINSTKSTSHNIPAHRIVNKDGLLTGKVHFGGENTMCQLLTNEGLIISENKILNFKENFWDPALEL